MEARQCLEGPKNMLPCGQQQARNLEPGKSKVRPWSTPGSPGRPVLPQQSTSQRLLALEPDLIKHPAVGCWVWGCRGDCGCWEGRLLLLLAEAEGGDLGCWGWRSVTAGENGCPQETPPHIPAPPPQAIRPQACYVAIQRGTD